MTRMRIVLLLGLALSLPAAVGLAKAASGRYVVDGTATTVFDTYTKLTWQRTAPSGDPNAGLLAWADAKAYCKNLGLAGGGWRLPEITELQTLVDFKQQNPAIDTTAFPGAPAQAFWSNTLYMGSPSVAWTVQFLDGRSDYPGVMFPQRVRCVR